MIRAEGLTKSFGAIRAVSDLSFSISEGSLFGFMGPDGAGKSTTLKLLSGILAPTFGAAWVNNLSTVADVDQIKAISRHMSQGFDLYLDLSVEENLLFFADIFGFSRSAQAHKIEQLMAFTHLAPFRYRQASKLSGGMKQKLALAVALVYTPKVLFLDEPTSGVDPVSRRDFWKTLDELRKQGVTLVVTTTYLDEAERCDEVALLHHGKLLALGSPRALKERFRDHLFEIDCEQPRKAARLLCQNPSGYHVDLYGSHLHLKTISPETTLDHVRNVLKQNELKLDAIKPIQPSLEDVFMSLIAETADAASR